MPVYGYLCHTKVTPTETDTSDGQPIECGHTFEILYQNHAAVEREEHEETCPKCSGMIKERLAVNTGTSFSLKGGGWAKDRYQ
jgi:predicted nucleic acid-binding Zn ribbon protein